MAVFLRLRITGWRANVQKIKDFEFCYAFHFTNRYVFHIIDCITELFYSGDAKSGSPSVCEGP
jgi:hypothetical protein